MKRVNVCADTKLAILDGGAGDFVNTAVRTRHLPRGAQVLDADVRVRLTHPAVGELDLLVTFPLGLRSQHGDRQPDWRTDLAHGSKQRRRQLRERKGELQA